MIDTALTCVTLKALPKVAGGKVRELFEVDDKVLLFVASDRISAYDVVMKNGIPAKGLLLTLLSAHWFRVLSSLIPDLKTHFITLSLPPSVPQSQASLLNHRSMQVRKLKIFPIEVIVRGYITGSAWKEYQKSSTVHGMPMAPGLQESQAFPQGAIYTPSTKAPAGRNDENIHPDEAANIVGAQYAKEIENLALKLYTTARDYALERGIIIADTKFEFGLDEATNEVVLVDEVLTPDSSRFWAANSYEVGKQQKSYDKQSLRDWLIKEGLKGKQDVSMPPAVLEEITQKYSDAFERLTGRKCSDVLTQCLSKARSA